MADILKISTPYLDRNAIPANKQVPESSIPFEISETTKVVKPQTQSELQHQNTGLLQGEDSPAILMNLLRDPTVTVNFLKNIYLLQEIINLIPGNNSAVTSEIQQMFDALLQNPQDIVAELARQENTATMFRGEFFDALRQLLAESQNPEMKNAITTLLRAINATVTRGEIAKSIGNNLSFLARELSSSKQLSDALLLLSQKYMMPSAVKNFAQLKNETAELLKQVEQSILFSQKMQKMLPLITYNMSRFNDNPDFFQNSITSLLNLLHGKEQRDEFMQKLQSFVETLAAPSQDKSKVMKALSDILGKQLYDENMTLANSDKMEKIIHSLLSSPCNFTPLLHFIVPVQDGNQRAFAELWIDPNSEETSNLHRDGTDQSLHFLIEFDVDGIGQFEAEMFVVGKKIDLNLMCPAPYVDAFMQIRDNLGKMMKHLDYSFHDIYIGRLERQRSLMEVFKSLPHRRTGIDVKI